MHIEKGRLSIACVCMVLGFMLAIQFRTTQDIRAALPIQRVDVLAAKLQQKTRSSAISWKTCRESLAAKKAP